MQQMIKKAKTGRMINYILIGISFCSCCLSLYTMYLSDLVSIIFSCIVIAALVAILPVDLYYLLRYSVKITPALKEWTAETFDCQRHILEVDGDDICFKCVYHNNKITVIRNGVRGQIVFDLQPLKGYLSYSATAYYFLDFLSAYYYKKTTLGFTYNNVAIIDQMGSKPKKYKIISDGTLVKKHPEKNYFIKNDLVNL
jgi:hypothetical protein